MASAARRDRTIDVASDRSPGFPTLATTLLATMLAALGGAQVAGATLNGTSSTMLACVAVLVLGLPHGALDWALLRAAARHSRGRFARALLVYVAVALAMLLAWMTLPEFALAVFLLVAVAHFAEDWRGARSPALAIGMGMALLAAPALTHADEVRRLFTILERAPDARPMVVLLAFVAPMALLLGMAALIRVWCAGSRDTAIAGACSLAGLLILPPLIGFALFFCLCHGPLQMRAALTDLPGRRWPASVGWLTLVGVGLCAAVYALSAGDAPSSRLVGASFMTLSILTAPHLVAPFIVAALIGRGRSIGDLRVE